MRKEFIGQNVNGLYCGIQHPKRIQFTNKTTSTNAITFKFTKPLKNNLI